MNNKIYSILILTCLLFSNCGNKDSKEEGKLNVVTTTTMLTDLLSNIGGEKISVRGLMGSGVDPHLYKASEGDVSKLMNADIIFYGGLHLEGKLEDVFEKMRSQNKTVIAASDALDKKTLISSKAFASSYDPHIWFDIEYWKQIANYVVLELAKKDPENKAVYEKNGLEYISKLTKLEIEIKAQIKELPKEKRILVTAHDAFNYFGKAFDFNVVGLQGLSTATEAGVRDVQKLADFIIKKKVKAVFVESSIPKRTIEALQKSVESKGYDVKIGGTLYSDALGSAGTVEGTYEGMYRYNVKTIVEALK